MNRLLLGLMLLVAAVPGLAEAGGPPVPAPEPGMAVIVAGGLAAAFGFRAYRKRR